MAKDNLVYTASEMVDILSAGQNFNKLYDSYKSYADNEDFNDFRGTSLNESARRNKDDLGLSEEDLKDSPIFIQALISTYKLAAYAGKGVDAAIANNDQEALAIIKQRQNKAVQAFRDLTNHKGDRDKFIETFSQITAMTDGQSNTFGEVTELDEGIRHDIGLMDEFTFGVSDASLILSAKELFDSAEEKEETATKREMQRTAQGGGDTGIAGMAVNLLGTVAAFTLETMLFHKAGTIFTKNTAEAQTISNAMRYIGQGFILPQVQNVNEQTGLTQKYAGSNEIENHYLKNLMDGAHNVAGMAVGDKILSPVLGKLFNTSGIKSRDALNTVLKQAQKSATSKVSFNNAISSLHTKIDAIPRLRNETASIIKQLGKNKASIDNTDITRALDQAWSTMVAKDLIWQKGLQFAGVDLAADWAFDFLTHNVVNTAANFMLDEDAFSVQQNRMFSISDIQKQGIGESLKNAFVQRMGMRTMAKAFNKIKIKSGRERMDLKDTYNIVGSVEYYKDLGINVKNPYMRAAITLNGFFSEDYLKQMDLYFQDTSGRSLREVVTDSEAGGGEMLNLVNAWYVRQYAGQNALLELMNTVDNTFDLPRAKEILDHQIKGGNEEYLNNIILSRLRNGGVTIKDLDDTKAEAIADMIMKEFPNTDPTVFRGAFAFTDIKTDKEVNRARSGATGIIGRASDTRESIDDRIMRRLGAVVSVINPASDKKDDLLEAIYSHLQRKITGKVEEYTLKEKAELDLIKDADKRANILGTDKDGKEINEKFGLGNINLNTLITEFAKKRNIKSLEVQPEDLERARKDVTELFKDDVVSGALDEEGKIQMVSQMKGEFLAAERDYGFSLKNVHDSKLDMSVITRILKDVSVEVAQVDISQNEKVTSLYDKINTLVEKEAKKMFGSYRDKMQEAKNNDDMSEDGKQRIIYANTVLAYTLATNVGYRWKDEVMAFGKELTETGISSILNSAIKNEKIFSKGAFAKIKDGWKDADSFAAQMQADLFTKINLIQEAKFIAYEQSGGRSRIDKQIINMVGEDDATWEHHVRSNATKPMYKHILDTSVDIKYDTDTFVHPKDQVKLEDDTLVNQNYKTMILNPNALKDLGYSNGDIVQLAVAATIKSFDRELAEESYLNRDTDTGENAPIKTDQSLEVDFGNGLIVKVSRENNAYKAEVKVDAFDSKNQTHLRTAFQKIQKSFDNVRDITKTMRDDFAIDRNEDGRIINGITMGVEDLVAKLEMNAVFRGFNLTHVISELMSRETNTQAVLEKTMSIIKFLDRSMIETASNNASVEALMKQFITNQATSYAVEYKFDLLLQRSKKGKKFKTVALEANNTEISMIGDLADGDIKVMNINFDEDINITDKDVLTHLRSMNIIPLGTMFKNDSMPIWVQVKELGDNETSTRELNYTKELVEKVMKRRANAALVEGSVSEDVLKDNGYTPKTFEEAILQAHFQNKNISKTTKDYMKKVMQAAYKYESDTYNSFVRASEDKLVITDEQKAIMNDAKESLEGVMTYLKKVDKDINGTEDPAIAKMIADVDAEFKSIEGIFNKKDDPDDTDIATSSKAVISMESLVENTVAKLIVKLEPGSATKTIIKEIAELKEGAYNKIKKYEGIIEAKSAAEDTGKAIKHYKENMDKKADSNKIRGDFYTLMVFNDAAINAKLLPKRISYMYAQNRLTRDGDIPTRLSAALDQALDTMLSEGGKMLLSFGNADGEVYVSKGVKSALDNTIGNSGGKWTSNAGFGAKIMANLIRDLVKSRTQLSIIGKGDNASDKMHTITKNDILFDLNSVKTLKPEFLKLLKLPDTSTSKKGDAFEVNLPIGAKGTNERKKMKKLLASLSLHTALKADAKRVSPSLQSSNLLSPWEHALNRAHTFKSNEEIMTKLLASGDNIQDLLLDPKRFEGKIKSIINQREGTGATYVARKYNELITNPVDGVGDTRLFASGADLLGEEFKGHPAANEGTISTSMLSTMGKEFYKNNKGILKGTPVKSRLRDLVNFFSNIDEDNWNQKIEDSKAWEKFEKRNKDNTDLYEPEMTTAVQKQNVAFQDMSKEQREQATAELSELGERTWGEGSKKSDTFDTFLGTMSSNPKLPVNAVFAKFFDTGAGGMVKGKVLDVFNGTSSTSTFTKQIPTGKFIAKDNARQAFYDQEVYEMMHILSGYKGTDADGKDDMGDHGVVAAFDMKTIGQDLYGRDKKIFAVNATRFPNHIVGQNSLVFLEGVTVGTGGINVKDNYYTKIFKGDWDGDTVQIMGINTNRLRGVKKGQDIVFGTTDAQILKSLFDWQYKALNYRKFQAGSILASQDGSKGVGEDIGGAIAGLSDAGFVAGLLDIDDTLISQVGRAQFDKIRDEKFNDIVGPTQNKLDPKNLMEYNEISATGYDRGSEFVIMDNVLKAVQPGDKSITVHGTLIGTQAEDGFKVNLPSGERQYKLLLSWTTPDGSGKSIPVYTLAELDNADFGFNIKLSYQGAPVDESGKTEILTDFFTTNAIVKGLLKNGANNLPKTATDDSFDSISRELFEKSIPSGFKQIKGIEGKRVVNTNILNDQINETGVENIKKGGLKYLFDNTNSTKTQNRVKSTVSRMSRKVALASAFRISKFSTNGKPMLSVFGDVKVTDYGDGNEQIKSSFETRIVEHGHTYISRVLEGIEQNTSGKYMTLKEFNTIKGIKKRKTATTKDYLEVAALANKLKHLIGTEETRSSLDPAVEEVLRLFTAIKDRFAASAMPAIEDRMAGDLKAKYESLNFNDLFAGSEEIKDDNDKVVGTFNPGAELFHLLKLEDVFNNMVSAFGPKDGLQMYKGLLRSTARLGKDVKDVDQFLEILRFAMDNNDPRSSLVAEANVRFNTIGDVKDVLNSLGVTISESKTPKGISEMAAILTKTGGNRKSMKIIIDNMKSNTLFARENQYDMVLKDKDGKELSISDLYAKMVKADFGQKGKKHAGQMMLMKALMDNLSEAGQLGVSMQEKGATEVFISILDKRLKEDSNLPKYTLKDIQDISQQRQIAPKDKSIFSTGISENVKSLMKNGINC